MSYAAIELENQLLQLKKAGIVGGRLIVCIGDSITYGYTVPRAAAWCALAGAMTKNRVINLGLCGDTTAGMLARAESLPDAPRIDAIALMGGGNDLMMGRTGGEICENLAAIARYAAGRGARPIVCLSPCVTPRGVQPFFTYPPFFADSDGFDAARREGNERLRAAAEQNGWAVADFSAALCRADGAADPACYNDNVHPNPEGHRRMAEVFAPLLQNMFPDLP